MDAATAVILSIACAAVAQEENARGAAVEHRSPNNIVERCIALAPVPGGVYSDADRDTERRYCAIDFDAPETSLCPKTWSTSPATLVYDVSTGDYAMDAARFELEQCQKGGRAHGERVSAPGLRHTEGKPAHGSCAPAVVARSKQAAIH